MADGNILHIGCCTAGEVCNLKAQDTNWLLVALPLPALAELCMYIKLLPAPGPLQMLFLSQECSLPEDGFPWIFSLRLLWHTHWHVTGVPSS